MALLAAGPAARAASPLIAIPFGHSVMYHIASQSNTPKNGSRSTSHEVGFTRLAPRTVRVTVDGVPGGTVSQVGDSAVIVGTGGDSTQVQPHVREFPTDVNVKIAIRLDATRMLTTAGSTVSIVVHTGRLGRTEHFGNSWTVARVPG